MPIVIVFTMFDKIIPNIPSHGSEYEKARTTAYRTWEGHCRTLFGKVRAEIVSSNYPYVCRADGLSYALLCFQRSRGFAI